MSQRPKITLGELRERAATESRNVLEADDPREPAKALWQLGMNDLDSRLAEGLWNIWGRITDEWTHPNGDPAEGARLARESAADLLEALGDEEGERAYSDEWIYMRLDIVPPEGSDT